MTRRRRGERGQSTVETLALLPLVAAVALAIGHLLAAGMARELAGSAAEAGAIAVLRGGDPAAVVRASLPEWSRGRVRVVVRGRVVGVRLEPPAVVPALGRLLAVDVRADAGPAARDAR